MKRKNKLIVGITGGIAVGKSAATRFFKAKGYPIVDADKIGHKILEKKSIKKELVANFGDSVLVKGKIDRKRLGKIVFNNKDELKKLNQIVHPQLINQIKKEVENCKSKIVFIDAALLLDWNMNEFCDIVILIKSSDDQKINRLKKFRNMSTSQAEARIATQRFNEKKADYIITNNGTLEEFYIELENLLSKLILKVNL